MTNPQRGFISPLVLSLIAILLIGGGAYVYAQKSRASQPVVTRQMTEATSTAPTPPLAPPPLGIVPIPSFETNDSVTTSPPTQVSALAPTLLPDLTTGPVSSSATAPLIAIFLSATVTNANASTGAVFSTLFQSATSDTGANATDIGAVGSSAYSAGESMGASLSYNFPASGTYYFRACADKSSAADAGVITESNENNNCGAWTAVVVSDVWSILDSAQKKGRDAKRIADIATLQLALELYYDSYGNYPLTLPRLAPYLLVIPTDPSATGACTTGAEASCYKYAALGSDTSCSSYHLGADLEVADSPALSSDADATAGTSDRLCMLGAFSSGPLTLGNFSGVDTGKCKASDTGIVCYDVNPLVPATGALKVPEIVTPNAEPQTFGPRSGPIEPS